jgi:hypothetical protein
MIGPDKGKGSAIADGIRNAKTVATTGILILTG